LWTLYTVSCDVEAVVNSAGHNALRRCFASQPHLIKAHEAEAMAMTRQQLDHILSGRRRPTLAQAIEIYKHTGIAPYLWQEKKGEK
jgi:plasmid maintenance system antidote protein VapI